MPKTAVLASIPASVLDPAPVVESAPVVETAPSSNTKALSVAFFLGLFALGALVYLGTIGVLPLVGRDEPRYVQIGREMLDSDDWITPRLGGFTWFEKPVLLYWMVAASFSVFGVSEWAARLGPALCGLGSAGLLWWSLRGTNQKWAQWSALALLSSGGMLAFSHGATFDIVLTFCVTLALAAWWKAQEQTGRATKLLALFWAGVGLAYMAKGLVAFVLTLGAIGLYALLRRERVKLGLWWGLPLALLVSGLWYGPVTMANGAKFINEFFVQHQFERFTSNKFKHHQPPWFYFEILPLLTLPWVPFLVWSLAKTRLPALREETPLAKLQAFGLAWMIVPFAFFSLSGSKLPSYILPAIPGAAILIGIAISQWAQTTPRLRMAGALTAFMLVGTAILTTSGPGVKRAEKDSARSLFEAAVKHGQGRTRVVFFDTTSRPAQFYAHRSLLYGQDGEPIRLEEPAQVKSMLQSGPLLMLVNDADLARLKKADLRLQTVADNGNLALVLARS